jgi:hypothetical protein
VIPANVCESNQLQVFCETFVTFGSVQKTRRCEPFWRVTADNLSSERRLRDIKLNRLRLTRGTSLRQTCRRTICPVKWMLKFREAYSFELVT